MEKLSFTIAKEYQDKAYQLKECGCQDIGRFRVLRKELMVRCGVTELEAINILNGYNVADYVQKYENLNSTGNIIIDEKKREQAFRLLAEMAEIEIRMIEQERISDELDGKI